MSNTKLVFKTRGAWPFDPVEQRHSSFLLPMPTINSRKEEQWVQKIPTTSWVTLTMGGSQKGGSGAGFVSWKSEYGWIIRMCIYWGICIQDPAYTLSIIYTLRKILDCISGFNSDWRVLKWLALKELQDSQLSLPCSDLWAKQLRLWSTVLAFLKCQEWPHRSSCPEERQAGRSHSAVFKFCKSHLLKPTCTE